MQLWNTLVCPLIVDLIFLFVVYPSINILDSLLNLLIITAPMYLQPNWKQEGGARGQYFK